MNTPILILGGTAGSGKDTVADFLVKNHRAVKVALADPMKRLARQVFVFSDDQLWGPSSSRNAADQRFATGQAYNEAAANLRRCGAAWIADVMPSASAQRRAEAFRKLKSWYQELSLVHLREGRLLTPRYTLQTLGTEWGRNFSKNLWVDYAIRASRQLLGGDYSYSRDGGLTQAPGATSPDYVVITDGRFANEIVSIKMVGGAAIQITGTDMSAQAQAAGVQGHASENGLKGVPLHWWDLVFFNDKSQGLEALEKSVDKYIVGSLYAPAGASNRAIPYHMNPKNG